jgi:riboflavin kinase/FMN adenylyltransferase
MRLFHSIEEAAASGALRRGAVAVGNFDGVHLGHRALLGLAGQLAKGRGAAAGALTFEPHPVRALRPQLAPPLLTPLPRKLELLAAAGVEVAVVQPFDLAWAATPAAAFVERDLRSLGVADVVVGWDFTAGHERARVEALRPLLAAAGLALRVVEPVTEGGLTVSSTKIREFLLEGNVEGAALLLARPYDLDGAVARGAGRGRGLGFATANVATAALLPARGVYAVRVLVGSGSPGPTGATAHAGVCNVGVKPTVETSGQVTAEVHLFDFDGRDLYGEAMRVAFVARLREERRFPTVEALRAQIAADAGQARALLGDSGPGRHGSGREPDFP